LIAQLELIGVAGLLGFMILTVIYYFAYAMKHSVGNTAGWEQNHATVEATLSQSFSRDSTMSNVPVSPSGSLPALS